VTPNFKTKALSLREKEWGETDFLFYFFTEDFGMVEILAKGARKITSKLRGQVIPFSLAEIEFVQGKYNKILTDAYLIKRFYRINFSPFRFLFLQKLLNIFFNLVPKEEKDIKLWNHLLLFFQKLEKKQLSLFSFKIIYYYFFWNLVAILGFSPQLFNCVFCQKRLKPEKLFFDSSEGGVICYQCYRKKKGKAFLTISPQTVKIIRKILEGNFEEILKLKITPFHFSQLKEISKDYYLKIKKEDEENL
jgi:DNA repair protein RecO (recombination protein O)